MPSPANTNPPAVCGRMNSAPLFDREALGIRIDIVRGRRIRFEGTASELAAEGLIPAAFEWPRSELATIWVDRGFKFVLRRCRPDAHRGPKASWLTVDNWSVYVYTIHAYENPYEAVTRYVLHSKVNEIARLRHALTPEGQRDSELAFKRGVAAKEDSAYQAFRALCVPSTANKAGRAAVMPLHRVQNSSRVTAATLPPTKGGAHG